MNNQNKQVDSQNNAEMYPEYDKMTLVIKNYIYKYVPLDHITC